MKTSNKIFISFLIFLFSGILLLFIGAKYFGETKKNNLILITQEKPLESFSVIIAEPGASFELHNGTQNKITDEYVKDGSPNLPLYVVKNDTLYMYALKDKSIQKGQPTIHTKVFSNHLKSIVAKESSIYVQKFKANDLKVNLYKSQLDLDYNKFFSVFIQANESTIYINETSIENLDLQLENTKLDTRITNNKQVVNKLSGSLKNKSIADFAITEGKINLDIDKTSSFNIFKIHN